MGKILYAALALSLFAPASAEAVVEKPADPGATAAMIEQTIRSKPEIVLEVIRQNPEVVLDAAQKGSAIRRERAMLTQWQNDLKNPKPVRLEGRPATGNPGAKVKIAAFSDFTCHFCAQASVMLDALRKEYGDDLEIVFKNAAPANSAGAVIAPYFYAIALQDGPKAWAFHDTVFANQRMIMESDKPLTPLLNAYAKELGVDMDALEKDLQSEKIRNMLTEDLEDAKKAGINGTPFFLVNELVIQGALPPEVFRKAIGIAKEAANGK